MAEMILVTGGARSGKSAYALKLAEGHARRVFVATAEAFDEEMKERIARHQAERGDGWDTMEAPCDLAGVVRSVADPSAVIVIDCLTVWLGNLLHHDPKIQEDSDIIRRAAEAMRNSRAGRVVVVTNEVGMSIVPENALARYYRDLAGRVNQRFAALADRVVLTVCGQALTIKGHDREGRRHAD